MTISSHKNKKALSSFYRKKVFLIENEYIYSFSIKNISYDKMDLIISYFHVMFMKYCNNIYLTKYDTLQCCVASKYFRNYKMKGFTVMDEAE